MPAEPAETGRPGIAPEAKRKEFQDIEPFIAETVRVPVKDAAIALHGGIAIVENDGLMAHLLQNLHARIRLQHSPVVPGIVESQNTDFHSLIPALRAHRRTRMRIALRRQRRSATE